MADTKLKRATRARQRATGERYTVALRWVRQQETSMKPTPGRIIHVRIGGDDKAPELRPAVVVRVWGPECVNAMMFLDGRNDERHIPEAEGTCAAFDRHACAVGVAWVTSVTPGDGVGEWRWPARQG